MPSQGGAAVNGRRIACHSRGFVCMKHMKQRRVDSIGGCGDRLSFHARSSLHALSALGSDRPWARARAGRGLRTPTLAPALDPTSATQNKPIKVTTPTPAPTAFATPHLQL